MKRRHHKTYCGLVNDIMGKGTKHMTVYLYRRQKYYSKRWWCEPPRHVRLTPEGILKAMKGSCSQGHGQVFKIDLERMKITKIFDGVVK